jgi:hypothetical protein
MRRTRLAAFALALLLAVGCGEILGELDNANNLAGKPGGNRTSPAPGNPGAVPNPALPGAPKPGPEGEGKTLTTVLSQAKDWLGLGEDAKSRRLPPDPNDPLVLCRLGGSNSFMLKSGCLNRQGTVVANKGTPH